jgi:hypothetical protein
MLLVDVRALLITKLVDVVVAEQLHVRAVFTTL